jgi:hypothetical protein
MNFSVKVDSAKLEFALAKLADKARVDLGRVIKQEGGLIASTLMKIIPPTTGKSSLGKPGAGGLSTKAKEAGENAIKGDLFGGKRASSTRYSSVGLFQRIGSSSLVPPRNGISETVGVRLGWEGSKKIRIMSRFWKPAASTSEMSAFHKRYRNARGRTGNVSQSTIGRWRVQDQMWIEDASADAYFNQLKSRVGWSKSGFAAAALACGIRVPAWIRRHASASGTTSFNFGRNPYVTGTATNIKVPDINRYIDNAMAIRLKITEQKISRLHANAAVNLGFAKVTGAGKVEYNETP